MIKLSNGIELDPESLIYVQLQPHGFTREFNEEIWNYIKKGDDKPTLVTVRADELRMGEPAFNMDGSFIGVRIE
ncbi:MAG: hypothetical protein Q4F97_06250 [Bacteroidales bacterium]|nr:hypothetical protein [Bacteroidales bacterium]